MALPDTPPTRRWSLPVLPPRLRTALRVLAWSAVAAYFAFAGLVLALRYAVLPQIGNYRGDIERLLSTALARPVAVRALSAHWSGLRPTLDLAGFEIRDAAGRPALGLEQVEAELSWSSLWHFELRLARLEIGAPDLVLRRDAQGRLYAAGLEITPQDPNQPGFADWLAAQDRIVVRDARLTWIDEQRGAAPLALQHVNLRLDNAGARHRLGITAEPPRELAARLDIRGEFKGRELDRPDTWTGQAYLELDYADLAVWRRWVDYPIDLPQGQGALRLWLDVDQQQITGATADLRLANVRTRLAPELPELDLLSLDGRLAAQRSAAGFRAELKRLTLATRDGIRVAPTDFSLAWQPATAKQPAQGSLSASSLDLDALARLAGHLPLDAALREKLAKHAPQGRIGDLKLEWKGTAEALKSWTLTARFDGVGLQALGPVPGVRGIGGRIDGSERGGSLHLDGRGASLDLPTIFPEPKLALDSLVADATWKQGSDGLQLTLQRALFQNRDAAGEASGSWQAKGGGPGTIDLSARLTRGSGDAVWRYMPLAVGKDARDWLRTALIGGRASEATLKLRGDLAHFPFRDGKGGLFEVRGKFKDATLRYAKAWPDITHIDGELLFSGVRMLITGKSARIFGVQLKDVQAEIADLEQMEEMLTVHGRALGPTRDFLKFIEASPVGERIDHFTEDMVADGNGELDLKLRLPLRKLADSRVDGSYRFDSNRLTVDPDLPPLGEVKGSLKFSSDHLEAKGIRGTLLGMPLGVDVATVGDGNVQVNANGELAIATLRRQFGLPLLDHLSGSARWTGTVRVKKKSAEVKIASNLVGISSSLPEPLNKSASEALALSFERKPPPIQRRDAGGVPRDMLDIALGKVARVQLVRRHDVTPAAITRGLVALGDSAATLPERGLLVSGNLKRFDADFWRRQWNGQAAKVSAGETALPPLSFDLRAGELLAFGKTFNEVRIAGSRPESTVRFELKSRQLAGNFEWNPSGAGRLSGRIGQFTVPESAAAPAALQAGGGEIIDSLPALDLSVDRLLVHNHDFGSLHLSAENRDGYWNAKLDMKNEDGQLEGSGRWRPDPSRAETQLDFKLTAKSVEKLLVRLGYPDAMRRGTATLAGNLAWNGTPFGIHYPSLSGKLKLDAASGQFNKLEPGIGRLLGILSLQSLPRRITLDFRDIFSEGFAFDSISGQFAVARGVMDTNDLQIQGPAAKVLMSGSVNLGAETQNLKVRVQPTVGESVATGVLLAHPATGVATWVMNKLLGNPLDRAFAFDYAISGTWADPKVEKLGAPPETKTEGQK